MPVAGCKEFYYVNVLVCCETDGKIMYTILLTQVQKFSLRFTISKGFVSVKYLSVTIRLILWQPKGLSVP